MTHVVFLKIVRNRNRQKSESKVFINDVFVLSVSEVEVSASSGQDTGLNINNN